MSAPCKGGCGRETITVKERREGVPGVTRHALGMCAACWRAGRRKRPLLRQPMPERCRGCDRPLRNMRVKIADAPGTVPHKGHGLCVGCNRRADREADALLAAMGLT